MSQYHNSQRSRGLYNPRAKEPFRLSRSKIDLFLECPRCFYFDIRLGVGRPKGFPFTLNAAVDKLLKQEFDVHRVKGTRHPLQEKYGIEARPVAHEELEKWRHNFTGVQFLHEASNFLVFGAIDDLWVKTSPQPSRPSSQPHPNPLFSKEKEYIVVDYKATAKAEEITELNEDWHEGYKRQMEVYQWLLRKNGYKVSDTGYFVYCNGLADAEAFDQKLEFRVSLIAYTGDDSWVEPTLLAIHKCLNSDKIPKASTKCDYCAYVKAINDK
jgi:hypothetical protein